LVSSSDGENIINIDEQLKTFNFYNKPLALEEHVEDNYISYIKAQTLTEAQKQIARNNIGAGTGGGGSVDLTNYVTLDGTQTITGKKTIESDFDVYSTTSDFTQTSHLSIKPSAIQLMTQDAAGKGGGLILTPSAGVQVSTAGNSKFTYNGKEVLVGGDIIDKIDSIKTTLGSNQYVKIATVGDEWGSLELYDKITNSDGTVSMGGLLSAYTDMELFSTGDCYVYGANSTTTKRYSAQIRVGERNNPTIVATTYNKDDASKFSELRITSEKITYNGKEIATKDDLSQVGGGISLVWWEE
jgi:hypothetical protein